MLYFLSWSWSFCSAQSRYAVTRGRGTGALKTGSLIDELPVITYL